MTSFDQRNQKSLTNLQNPLEMIKGALSEEVRLPSIVEFAEHPSFLGADRLFPRQKTLLRLMCLETENMTDYDIEVINKWAEMFNPSDEIVQGINPDIWKRVEWLKANGYDHFKEIITIIGRRGGKNHLGAILLAYQLWKLILLDDPQEYYGVARGKSIYVTVVATAEKQAKIYQFADLINLISEAKCFAPYIADMKDYSFALTTPADKRRIASLKTRGIDNQRLIASVRGIVASSNAAASRGGTVYSVVFDEFAHMIDGSVAADRLTVVKTPDGHMRVWPIETVFEKMMESNPLLFEGNRQGMLVEGWQALSMDPETREAKWYPIRRAIRYPFNGQLKHITQRRGETVVTNEHSVMVDVYGKKIMEFKPDELDDTTPLAHIDSIIPRGDYSKSSIDLWEYVKDYNFNIKGGRCTVTLDCDDEWIWAKSQYHYTRSDGRRRKDAYVYKGKFKRFIENDELADFCRLFGGWCAEGSGLVKSQLTYKSRWDITQVKSRKWLEDRRDELNRFRDETKHVDSGKQITVERVVIAAIFSHLGGQKSRYKKVPDFIWDVEPRFQNEFLKTFVEGDGTFHGHKDTHENQMKDCIFSAFSTSLELMSGITTLLSLMNLPYGMMIGGDRRVDKRKGEYAPYYRQARTAYVRKTRTHDNLGKFRTKVWDSNYEGYVYDFEVDEVNTFVDACGLILLHNTEGPRTSNAVYQSISPALDQFQKDALIFIPTSPYCLVPETPVLLEDLTWVPVGSLKVGDKLIGFDEHAIDEEENGRNWRQAIVTETSIINAPTFKLKTNGPEVVCTGEHLWLTKKISSPELQWVKTNDLKPGDKIKCINTGAIDMFNSKSLFAKHFYDTKIYDKISKYAIVESVTDEGTWDVVALGTSTKTLLAAGMFSHNTETGMAYELYRNSIKTDKAGNPEYPTMLTVQLPSWSIYDDWDNVEACDGLPFNRRHVPQLYDAQMRALEQREPETFRVERLSQWAKVTDAFLNPRIVERIFQPFKDSNGIERILTPQDQGKLGYIYYGHADPSKNNNNFAVMVAHAEDIYDAENNETWTHVLVDYINCYKPEDFPEHQIDYALIEDDLIDVLDRFRSIRKFTFDQYGSFVTVDRLKKRIREMRPAHKAIILEEKASLQSNMRRAERFKSAIGMNWVHSFKDNFGPEGTCLLEQELKSLQLKNGKVQKQNFGPIRTEDLSDSLQHCVDNLLEDNFHKLEIRDKLGKTTLGIAAMGGYHSHTPSELANVGKVSARQKLNSFSGSWRNINNQHYDPTRGRRGRGF